MLLVLSFLIWRAVEGEKGAWPFACEYFNSFCMLNEWSTGRKLEQLLLNRHLLETKGKKAPLTLVAQDLHQVSFLLMHITLQKQFRKSKGVGIRM